MTWSSYLTAIRNSFQRSARTGPIGYVILHHGATTNSQWMVDVMVNATKQVSATAVVKDTQRIGIVDEDFRPWTSSSAYWDGRACTIECANQSTVGWTISDASYESMAMLLADWSIRHNFPLNRTGHYSTWTVYGHRELYTFYGDSYATACPGGMDLDRVVNRANEIKQERTRTVVDIKEFDYNMSYVIRNSKTGGIYHIAPRFIKHFNGTEDYGLLRNITAPDDKLIELTDKQFLSVLDGFGIPQTKIPNFGAIWSPDLEIVAALNALLPDKE